MIQARDYQDHCIQSIWRELTEVDDIMVQLPTGAGKTIIFVKLIKLLLDKYEGLKINILVNKIKLVEQTKDKLLYAIGEEKIGLYCGSLGEYQDQAPITVGSIQSISLRTLMFNLMVIDECHNEEGSATYRNYVRRCREANPKLKIVRFTATPFTMKGYIYGEDKICKKLAFKRTLNQMIAEGYLVPPVFKSTKEAFNTSELRTKRGEYIMADVEKMSKDEEKCRRQVADALPRLNAAGRKKVVWAATCIEHAEMIQKELERQDYVGSTSLIHSELSSKVRVENLKNFEDGDTRHLISIMIVTEGYDYPPIDAIAIMRPTRSPVLYVQLVGRGLRLSPGKEDCLVLDYGEVVEYFGHPSDPYVPNTGKKKDSSEKKCLICPACETINFLPRRNCSSCGYEFMKEDKKEIIRTKALTNEAANVELNENGRPELILNVILCDVNNDYVSKSTGSKCIKVTYTTMVGSIYEYIKKETFFHRQWNTDLLKHKATPKKIRVEKKGKYYELRSRIYE